MSFQDLATVELDPSVTPGALQTQLRRNQSGSPPPAGVLADIDGTMKDLRHFKDSVLRRIFSEIM